MKTYMFCNAHLEPVWLWQWESGLSEALSTFRAASDFIDEYPNFIFNHNESLLYEWIEEHEPELFRKIQRQVKEGRWEIIGGCPFIIGCALANISSACISYTLAYRNYNIGMILKLFLYRFDKLLYAKGLFG